MKKIVIGSANFNQKYGLYNFKHSNNIIKNKLLKTFKKKKINYIDISFDYNLNKKFFQKINFKNFKVISKIKLPKKNIKSFIDNLEKKLQTQIKYLKVKKFYAMLFHNSKDLNSPNGKKLLNELIKLKKKNYFDKLGVSIYDTYELKSTFKKFKPELVQVPINIFDQRILNTKWIKYFKKKKILIQARSIFLQGLILSDIKDLKYYKFESKLQYHLQKLNQWCINKKISRIEACILFVKNIKEIDLITVGFESENEFIEIIKTFKKNRKLDFSQFKISEKKIIDPRKWQIKIR